MSAGLTRRRLLGFAAAAPVCAKAATGASDAGLTSLPQDWDVIVIGSGLAGLTAAVTARESGAERGLVLEKGPLAGGHTLYSAGSIAVLSPKRQKPFGIEDSADLWVQDARKAVRRCRPRTSGAWRKEARRLSTGFSATASFSPKRCIRRSAIFIREA